MVPLRSLRPEVRALVLAESIPLQDRVVVRKRSVCTLDTAQLGLETYRDGLDADDVPHVDASEGVAVAWRDGSGWREVADE